MGSTSIMSTRLWRLSVLHEYYIKEININQFKGSCTGWLKLLAKFNLYLNF